MTLLSAERICKKFDDQVIFNDVSFTLQSGERIGLVGKNGSGKTTLFEIMAGRMETDSGVVTASKACTIDYVEQEKEEYLNLTLFEFVASAREDLLGMRREIALLESELAENPRDDRRVERLGELQNQFEIDGGFSFENEVAAILEGLGFEKERRKDLIRNFSGGEKNRAALARALAGKGNLLLLDEPTNHLDIDSTTWLEEYLQNTGKSFIAVSHDRAFLTAVTSRVWEINLGKLDQYACGFAGYLKERAERRRLHAHRYRHQQEEIKRLEEFVRRHMAGQKTKQAQSKLKYLGRIKRLPPPRADGRGPSIRMNSSGRSFAHVLALDNISVGYGPTTVVGGIGLDLYRGDKIGVIGRNGSGKTTLLRSLIGELAPIEGDIKLGNNVDVAYFDQELSDLKPELTVIDNLWELDPGAEIGKIRSFLGRFGFTGDDGFKVVRSLSGGEKTKLSLARLLYHPANFIIFDEPTNHLDIDSREALELALSEYDGSCLIVSHDRYFLDRVVNRIAHIADGHIEIYDGNYSDFRDRTTLPSETTKPKDSKSKDAYRAFKEESRRRSRHKKELQSVKSRIADQELEAARLEKEIDHGIPRSDWEMLHDATERKKQVEETLLELYARLGELEDVDLD